MEKKDGKELLRLIRLQKSCTVKTLDGFIVTDYFHYNYLQDQIQILSKTIGGRAKTRIRKECKERGISVPNFKLEGN